MTIDLQQVINSSLSLRLVSSLAHSLPPRVGYQIANRLADQIARHQNSRLVQAVRANQWIAQGATLQAKALDEVVRQTLRYSAHSLFDLYHYNSDFEATRGLLVFDSSIDAIAHRPEFDRRGLVIGGLHLSSFDLVLQWLCKHGLKPMVITIPNPQGGRQVEYEIRKRTGMNLIPASIAAFRQALRHLQRGGMVLTGIDRPVENPYVCPQFFGYPSALPIHHIFLAIKACVPIILAAPYLQPDGKYHVVASEPIEMDSYSNAAQETLCNAEKVLAVAEQFIRRFPQQWSVPLPVWPQCMDLVPR